MGGETWITDQTLCNGDYCWDIELFYAHYDKKIMLTAALNFTIYLWSLARCDTLVASSIFMPVAAIKCRETVKNYHLNLPRLKLCLESGCFVATTIWSPKMCNFSVI